MEGKEECPKCLGIGEVFKYTLKKCNLCNGEGEVVESVASSFISNLTFINE